MQFGITIYDDDSIKPIPLRLMEVTLVTNGVMVGTLTFSRSRVMEMPPNSIMHITDIPNPAHPQNQLPK